MRDPPGAPDLQEDPAAGRVHRLGHPAPTLDLITAVAAGAAGAYGLSRPDVSDSLPGVAIAISLVPPLAVVGIAWSQGDWSAGSGALLLFATNMVSILIIGGATFVATGVAPIRRLAENQNAIRTAASAVVFMALVVLAALLLNGAQISSDLVERIAIEGSVEEWLEDQPSYALVSLQLDDGRGEPWGTNRIAVGWGSKPHWVASFPGACVLHRFDVVRYCP